ncbi:gamma-tubulin complex component 6 [Athalia rosae]|uniref:gamma-tubulin complex component 6 n=1 Tax=Athalia rosae TaxID=37344 RepID=UPI002034058F|nr:gamma-tubulin complex component 6 [Athalia rosae]XP_048504748.1 gamma-tubulin complex component 6 [Athalia rosae]XP_048504749.1 gamma-tubulin complex component 6 [Athalia rosae]XP_048504750.1 gamma-tubulin complex component 6 [Athalia rosae]XP_048504751.1 gamma-tubulin complex component 6 [Athalia rosae]
MDQSIGDTSTYTLITELCGHLLKKHCVAEQHPYIPQKDYSGSLKKLRSKAYGILLNKSPETHELYVSQRSKDGDPIVQLFKHSFVLKVGKKFVAKAEELESLLNELINTENDRDSAVYSTLQLLVGLKQLESEEQEQKLNVFHYGKANPLLPGSLWNGRGVTPFQIYPMESFVIPQIFENMLGIQHSSVIQNCAVEPGSRLLFLGRFKSTTTMAIESIQSGNPLVSMASLSSRGIVELAPSRHYNMPSHFFPNIVEDVQEVEDDCYVENEDSISEEASSWKCVNCPQTDPSNSDSWEAHASDQIFNENSSASQLEFCDIWENMVTIQPVSNYRTWETLGQFDPPKQPHFITETPQAMFHLRRIKLANFLQMTSVNDEDSVNLIKEIPSKQFLSDLKLLLLGIESESFVYDNLLGFQLQPNLAIPGLSIEGLKAVCDPVTQWGNCFKALTILTSSNSQTSELEQKGLIFKAMCNKIKEVLLRHRLAIGRLSVDEGSTGLLALLDKVRPLCVIITELSRLCRCDSQNEVELDNGLGILTHIYQEVTKITQPRVAFVFYSILKACCEVYFWFLQKWLFEGVCDDVYGEFMIKVKPQYLRQRGHRFWTKGFAINQKSVPGFLKELTDAILQCGKAVRLLKVCDSKNPLCSVLATSYPAVRVCLSVGQLREQQMHCNEYLARGRSSCGPIISLCSALQEEREILKKKAQIVNVVHQEMLVRIKREQEETARQVAQGKRELLAKLKDQAEEAVLRKEKAKEAQLHADQLLMERINREQKEEAEKLQHEKENVRTYYNELAAEADRRKLHADWRIRRMQLFDERIAALYAAKNELWQIKDPSRTPDVEDNAISDKEFPNDDCVNATDKNAEKNVDPLSIENSDCNSDDIRLPAEPDETEVDANANQQGDENSNVPPIPTEKLSSENTTENMEDEEVTESISVKSPRPTVLEIKPISLSTEPIEIRQDLLAKDTLQKNKNRIMGHTVFAGEDYREDRGNTKNNMRNFLFDRTDITNEALANRLRNTGNLDAFTELDIVADKIIANKLDLDELAGTDNMSELQRNKLKILREEYNWTPNNNEMKGIISENRRGATFGLTDHEKCDEMMISSTTEDPLSEMEINRNRNVQHRTDQSCNNVPENKVSVDRNLTDAEKNREKSMAHRTGQEMPTMVIPENIITELTDAQKNRNRNMQHSTDQGMNDVPEEMVRSQPGILTDAQKNRAKVMDQEYHIYGSALIEKLDNDNDLGISFPISKSTSSHQVVLDTTTPMSCTTDNFPLSMSSSTSQFQQCMDTPLSEMSSEMRSVLTTGEILTADTVRSDVTESGFKFPERSPMFPNFLGFGSAAMTPTSESTLTIADVEMIDNTSLHVYLEKSVRIPLQVQSSLVNDAIIKYLLEEHKFLSHLHSLRSYFFLLNGEFAKNLTKSLFTRLYEISSPAELLNSATLNNLLVKALVASLSGSYANSERLSLSVTDVPGQLQVSNPEALECLSLNYKISWPLNIILDEISMLQYSKVFKFLLMVGRVMWVLQEDFHLLKIERKAANSKQYHAIQLFRHSMMQFMTALHNYLTCSVLHASWAEFEKDLEHALTIDQVYLTHVSYIKKILSRCMLNPRGEKVRACLHNIFKVILKFHNRVRSQSWVTTSKGSVHPNYVKLEQLYKAFCELRSYMAHVAEKLANSGYQPHLTHFLNALNINCLYDLNVKRKE